jgi:hypothetical protein
MTPKALAFIVCGLAAVLSTSALAQERLTMGGTHSSSSFYAYQVGMSNYLTNMIEDGSGKKMGGRVEERRGGWSLAGVAPFPFPAHQTGRADFPHPAFRLASSRGPRRRSNVHASKTQHAKLTEDLFIGEPVCAVSLHLVPFA